MQPHPASPRWPCQLPLHWQKLQPTMQVTTVAKVEMGSEAPVKCIENCSFLYTRHLNMYFVALNQSTFNPGWSLSTCFNSSRSSRIIKAKTLMKMWCKATWCSFMNCWMRQMTLATCRFVPLMSFDFTLVLVMSNRRMNPNWVNWHRRLPEPSIGIREGICHKRNEVYIDVLELVNLLLSSTGSILWNKSVVLCRWTPSWLECQCTSLVSTVNSSLKKTRKIASHWLISMIVPFIAVCILESLMLITPPGWQIWAYEVPRQWQHQLAISYHSCHPKRTESKALILSLL